MDGFVEFVTDEGVEISLKIIYVEETSKRIYQYFDVEMDKWQRASDQYVEENWKQYFILTRFVMFEKFKKDDRIKIRYGKQFFTIE